MKKELLYFILIGFLGSKNVLSVDTFEIGITSDRIVGNLWCGSEVPQESIAKIFNLMDVKDKKQDIKEQEIIKKQIDSIITAYQESLLNTAIHRDENEENIANINSFITTVRALENKFSLETIADSLNLIASKF